MANQRSLRNTPLSAFQTLSIDIRRISGAKHCTQIACHIIQACWTAPQYRGCREHSLGTATCRAMADEIWPGPTHKVTEAAREPTSPPTTTNSGHASGLYSHLHIAERQTGRFMTLCTHPARRHPQPCIGPLQQVQRRSRRGRTQNGGTSHQDRLWGRSRRLRISSSRGASAEPRNTILRPSVPLLASSARPPAAVPATALAVAREATRRSPLLPATAASEGDPRLSPHLRLALRRLRCRSIF